MQLPVLTCLLVVGKQVVEVLVELAEPFVDVGDFLGRALGLALLEARGGLQLRKVVQDPAHATRGARQCVAGAGREATRRASQSSQV
eukprot:6172572-Pleurochrysis_carterae.AAC.1